MRKTVISVIVPTYNTALLIERTLRSVLAQSCQDFEILVVDDCSTDDTLDIVRGVGDSEELRSRVDVFSDHGFRIGLLPEEFRSRVYALRRGEGALFPP